MTIAAVQEQGPIWTVERCLSAGAKELARAGIDNARAEARLLLSHVTGWPRERLIGYPEDVVEPAALFHQAVARRAAREPMSHILGHREFWSRDFRVGPDVLDPRPDTETLIEAALDWARTRRQTGPLRILDFGTGSGAILLTLLAELPDATGCGIDLSEAALAIADANAAALGLTDRVRFIRGSWGAGLNGQYDLIVSNPPYIPSADIALLEPEVARYEPRLALDGGADGLLAYRNLLPHAARLKAAGGQMFLELGIGQADSVSGLAKQAGLLPIGNVRDLSGIDRVLILQ